MGGLAEPIILRGRTAQSRVLFGPHETNLALRRAISDRHVAYYARRAAGGAGVVVTEVASVHGSDRPYERAPLVADAGPGWAAVAQACRPHGTLVLAGLGHAGGQGGSAYGQQALWAPSRVPDPVSREVPMEVEQAEIEALVAGFATAAAVAARAGLDGVEVAAGQHSILRQFLSGLTNRRADGYGTDRTRLLREVLAAVRAALGEDRVLGLRLCCDELAPWAGITPEQGAAMAGAVAGSVDYLVPVRGSGLSVWATRPDLHTEPGFNRELCAQLRGTVPVPVVLQGSVVDPAFAQRALDDGVCDLVEMTRAQIAEPDLVAHVRAGTLARIRPCTLSNQRTSVRDPRNPIVSDDAEPRAGHETEDPPVEGTDAVARDVLVVGGGPAGLEAARVLALRGHRVRLVERDDRLGGALRLAAAVASRARMGLLVQWWERELARLGVDVTTGVAADPAMLDAAVGTGAAVLLATGSQAPPARFPGLHAAALEAAVLAAGSTAAALDRMPAGPVVVHDPVGDGTGVGVAEQVAAAGRPVVLVTPDQVAGVQLARTGDLAPANARLARAGVRRELRSRLLVVRDGRALLEHVWTGEQREIDCALVIDCAHRLPSDELWRARPHLPRAGDCVAPRTVHEAVLEGRRAALSLTTPLLPTRAHSDPDSRALTPRLARTQAPTRGAPASRGLDVRESGSGCTRVAVGPASRGGVLFSPLRVGPLTLPNRVVFCAHLTNAAVDGLPTEQHAAYYAARAAGGAGMIITEEHAVHPADRPYEKLLRGFDPAVVPGMRRLTRRGARPRRPGARAAQPQRRPVLRAVLPAAGVGAIAGAGPDVPRGPAGDDGRGDPRGRGRVRARGGALRGRRVRRRGDPVLAGLPAETVPLAATNRRTDGYGGALGNRVRIVREVVAAVRDAVGPHRAIGVRLCGDEGIEGGTTLAEAVATARILDEDGLVDYLNTSVGVATATLHMVEPPMPVAPGYALHVAAAITAAVGVPVVGVGRLTNPTEAERALADGRCDLVGVVRGQIADPAFAAPTGPNRTCVACNQECSARVGLNQRLGCLVNPTAGREAVRLPAPRSRRHLLVVGGGPAGLSAAATAARRGHRVTLCEREPRTGGQVEIAALAPARAGFAAVVRDLLAECVGLGVEIRTGRPVDRAVVECERPDAVVLATGARPARPGWAAGLARAADVRDVLTGRVAPAGSVLVYDEMGFHEATSAAEHLAARGCVVEIATPAMVVGQDLGLTLDLELFHRRARAAGIAMTTDRVVLAAAQDGPAVALTVLDHAVGETSEARYDWVVTAVPPEPEDELWRVLRRWGGAVHRIGDCLAPRRADAAVREGHLVGVEL